MIKLITTIIAALICVFFSGCGSTATIKTSRGNIEAEIVSSTENTLTIVAENGKKYTLSSEHVYSVDHPGDVAMVICGFGIVSNLVMLSIYYDYSQKARDEGGLAAFSLLFTEPAMYGSLFGVVAHAGMFLLGTLNYTASKSAASNFIIGKSILVPQVFFVDDKKFYGASFSLRF